MEVTEGTISKTAFLFLPEILFRKDSIDTHLKNTNDIFLSDAGRYGLAGEEINENEESTDYNFGAPVGTFDGPWKFWNDMQWTEKDQIFDYTPRFVKPNLDTKVSSKIIEEYSISDYDSTIRIIYYPFGLITFRTRTYFKNNSGISVEELVRMRYDIGPCTTACPRTEDLLQNLRSRLLESVFTSVPDKYSNKDISCYPIYYIYDWKDFTDRGLTKLLASDPTEPSDRFVKYKTSPKLGRYEGDMILTKKSGTVIYTPVFEQNNQLKRRKRRMRVLNNAYLSTEIGMFENRYLTRITSEMNTVLDHLVHGSLSNAPMKSKDLAVLLDILDIPVNFRGLRSKMYQQIKPEQKRSSYEKQLNDRIRDICQHDSSLKEALKTAPFGIFRGIL